MKRDAMAIELRVLSGRHAGACVAARDNLMLGAGDEADVILTDLASDAGAARLYLVEGGRWLLWSATEAPDAEALAKAPRWGVPGHWGGVALCVCEPNTDWPEPPPEPVPSPRPTVAPAETSAPADPGSTDAESDVLSAAQAAPAPARRPDTRAGPRRRTSWVSVTALVLIVLVALAVTAWQALGPSSTPVPAPPIEPVDQTAQAEAQIPDLQLAIAQVDPGLRMRLTPRADGRVDIQGWVASIPELDRLAGALSARRPSPVLRVRVTHELRAELRALLAGSHAHLDFAPDGPIGIQVRGIVLGEAGRRAALDAVRAVLPTQLTLRDGLRLAEDMAVDVRNALVLAGFPDTRAQWNGDEMVVTVPLPGTARGRLEKALLGLTERFAGLPLRIVPEPIAPPQQASLSPAPFAIRGVVGGPAPYLILSDGGRVLPGGSHAGWRLEAIEDDVLLFDAPRRIRVAR